MSFSRLYPGSPLTPLAGSALLLSLLLPGSAATQIVGGQMKTHRTMGSGGPSSAIVGDIDRDGVGDYAVGTSFVWSPSTVTVFSGRTGEQLLLLSRTGTRFGHGVAGVGDVNRDGYPDLLVAEPGFTWQYGTAYVFSGKDGAELRAHGIPGASNNVVDVAAAGDVNRDGVGDYMVSKGSVFLYSGADGSLLHTFHSQVTGGVATAGRTARDLDRDGVPDIVLHDNGRLRAYSGADFHELWSVAGGVRGIGIGDADGDGFNDVVTGNSSSGGGAGVVVVLSGRDGRQIHLVPGTGGRGLGKVVGWTGDVNRDGRADFAAAEGNLSIGAVLVFSGRDGSLLMRNNVPTESICGAGDHNGDGFPDVLVSAYSSFASVFGIDPFMAPTAVSVSASQGGTIGYAIDFPGAAANDNYLVLMSASGTGPFAFGAQVPLTIDSLMVASLQGLLAPLQTGFVGTLSEAGKASASLDVPPGLFAGLVGSSLQLAAVSYPTGGQLRFSSVANRLTVRP